MGSLLPAVRPLGVDVVTSELAACLVFGNKQKDVAHLAKSKHSSFTEPLPVCQAATPGCALRLLS